jgi:hypothetical protein
MAAFYFDEDVPEDLVPLLTERGHIVATTRSEGRKGAPDPRQLLYAAGRGWILVTLNRGDYRLLHDACLCGRTNGVSAPPMLEFLSPRMCPASSFPPSLRHFTIL